MIEQDRIVGRFSRGLNAKGVDESRRFLSTSLGHAILESRVGEDFRYQPFIRDNYIDFYWAGCRLLKYQPLSAKNRYRINRAYLHGDQKGGNRDVTLTETDGELRHLDVCFRQRCLEAPDQAFGNWIKRRGRERAWGEGVNIQVLSRESV